MPPFDVDLNDQPPESGDLYPIDWDDIGEYDGLAHQLDYDMVCDDGTQGKSTKIFVLPSVSSVHEFISVLQHLARLSCKQSSTSFEGKVASRRKRDANLHSARQCKDPHRRG